MKKATILVCLLITIMTTGCNGATTSWYKKFNWKAEDYFDDPKVIALCKAIEAKDLQEIDRLVADGADVNAKGKGNMTPLLWAYPENKPEVFKRILEHGADPNVEVTSDFNTRMQGILPGDSVLHLAAGTWFPNYFKYVMQHGGDPNLIRGNKWKESPLITVISGSCPDKKEAIQLLIDAGADLNYVDSTETTALHRSAGWGSQYDLTLQLLNAGTSFNVCKDNGGTVVHSILRDFEMTHSLWTSEQKQDYTKVLEFLKANGADLEGAQKDRKVWANGGQLSPGRIAELKKRYANELAAKQAAREKKDKEKNEP